MQFFGYERPDGSVGIRNHVLVLPGGLIGTTFRFITSPVIVPIQRIFTERAPADGKADWR